MATIGTFKRDQTGYAGTITTLTLNDKGPSFRLFVGKIEVGAAWAKVSRDGRAYLSAKMNDPSFLAPVYATLVEDAGIPGQHTLIWSRRQAE